MTTELGWRPRCTKLLSSGWALATPEKERARGPRGPRSAGEPARRAEEAGYLNAVRLPPLRPPFTTSRSRDRTGTIFAIRAHTHRKSSFLARSRSRRYGTRLPCRLHMSGGCMCRGLSVLRRGDGGLERESTSCGDGGLGRRPPLTRPVTCSHDRGLQRNDEAKNWCVWWCSLRAKPRVCLVGR